VPLTFDLAVRPAGTGPAEVTAELDLLPLPRPPAGRARQERRGSSAV